MTVMAGMAVWHGSTEALWELQRAIVHHCTCEPSESQQVCPAHRLLTDQQTLDHLAAVKFDVNRFTNGEWRRGRAA